MKTATVTAGQKNYAVTARIILCGNDIAIIIGGGETPHIGAVALGSPRLSLQNNNENSASASVLCRLGHKDDLLARNTAIRLAGKYNANVAVTVGLHIDNATDEDIKQLQQIFQKTLEKIETWLSRHTRQYQYGSVKNYAQKGLQSYSE